MKIIIYREEIERVISHLTIPDTFFEGNALARRALEKILIEHPYKTNDKGVAIDEGSLMEYINKYAITNKISGYSTKKFLVDEELIEKLYEEITYNQTDGIKKTRLGLESILNGYYIEVKDISAIEDINLIRLKLNNVFDIISTVHTYETQNDLKDQLQKACDILSSMLVDAPKQVTKLVDDNKQVIIEILDMLEEFSQIDGLTIRDGYATNNGKSIELSSDMFRLLTLTTKANALKTRLTKRS